MTHPTDYLAAHGRSLIVSGYEVVPIKRGLKHPGFEGWQAVPSTLERLDGWLANGKARDGVGIRAAYTPAIDIDVLDDAVSEQLATWCQAEVGFAPVRVGLAPKRMLIYRATEPFKKMTSAWTDAAGRVQKIEILGDGQQFVAWAIHPDTKRPYEWIGRDTPLTIPHADLEELTVEKARSALAEFDRLAGLAGWIRKGVSGGVLRRNLDHTDALARAQPEVEIDDDELRILLDAIPERDDYDQWVNVGMALHHHYRGTDDGLDLWREWSSASTKFVDAAIDRKWPTFAEDGDRPVKTARYIIMLGREALKVRGETAARSHKEAFVAAASQADLRRIADLVSADTTIDQLSRESLIGALRNAWRRIEGSVLPLPTARTMVKFKRAGEPELPNWLKAWLFVTCDDSFYNRHTGQSVTTVGFNAEFNRHLLTSADRASGKKAPETPASIEALNHFKIPIVDRRVYLPGEDDLFGLNSLRCINTYRDDLLPVVPDPLTARDQRNVETVEQHFRTLIPDRRECDLVLSYLAYIAQTNRRINWALFIQGTESDGKSFIHALMGAVLGPTNVKTIAPQTLGAQHTSWAEGSQVAIIEEVMLQGHNRHDIMNSIKPLITNAVIEVHVKHQSPVNVPNTQSYILLSNHINALPIGANDTRYFPIRSPFQSRADLAVFRAANPGHYERLFSAIEQSAGALRGWLLRRMLHAEFDPKARAPWSRTRDYMAQMAQTEDIEALSDAITATTRLDVCPDMLDIAWLLHEAERVSGEIVPLWKARRFLSDNGWTFLGRIVVGSDRRQLWSQRPELYRSADSAVDHVLAAQRAMMVI